MGVAARLREVTPTDAAALGIALVHERSWVEATEETGGDWPASACVETCVGLLEDLGCQLPEAEAEYVWGTFTIHRTDQYEMQREHAWIGLDSGAILDPTAGQFYVDCSAVQLVLPGDSDFWRYRERTRGLPRGS